MTQAQKIRNYLAKYNIGHVVPMARDLGMNPKLLKDSLRSLKRGGFVHRIGLLEWAISDKGWSWADK